MTARMNTLSCLTTMKTLSYMMKLSNWIIVRDKSSSSDSDSRNGKVGTAPPTSSPVQRLSAARSPK